MRTLVLVVVVAACGDNAEPDILDQLNSLAGITAVEDAPPQNAEAGYRYFDLSIATPIDHDGDAGTFALRATLMHRDTAAPLVVYAGGYDLDGAAYALTEPATIVGGNQVALEYRFYGDSVPTAGIAWPDLRVEQWGADQHAIVAQLASIYSGPRIATGGSKGGENALEQMQLYPGDYAGVVAYVPPVITAFPDERYEGELDTLGDSPTCRDALRAIARELLIRRDTLQPMFAATASYTVAGIAHSFETAVVELEFSFWMTRGIDDCDQVPATTDTDANLALFLEATSPPEGYDDATLATSGSQYIYQDHVELGYPVWDHQYLDDLMMYSYEDWSAYMPPNQPTVYDPTLAIALADWVTNDSQHVMLVGGQYDPWGAGYPPVAPGRDAYEYLAPMASHWSTFIATLAPSDEAAALNELAGWAQVPVPSIDLLREHRVSSTRRGVLRR
jgi:hypothetical protein